MMAQLTDDCFAFDGPLMTAADALSRITSRLSPIVPTETCPLHAAPGRILAQDICAAIPIPSYANSAVDGFAVFHDDLSKEGPTTFPLVGRVAAGQPLGRPMMRGEAVQIFTGGPVPDGPDTIMMLEDCTLSEDRQFVTLAPGLGKGANLRPIGDDVSAGSVVLQAGKRLEPQDIGMCAACGLSGIEVYAPLSVALLSTGDEVREPGTRLDPGTLYDSNRFTLGAALSAIGCQVEDLAILPDDADRIRDTLLEAADRHRAIITSGGMSMGEEDHVRKVAEDLGVLSFWRVAIKPGRPIAMGLIPRRDGGNCALLGLPGNPVAALTTFIALARPALQILGGQTVKPPQHHRVITDFDYKKKAGSREFVRVHLTSPTDETGLPVASKHGRSGAGVLSSLVGADGFVEFPEDITHIKAGTPVSFLSFAEVFR